MKRPIATEHDALLVEKAKRMWMTMYPETLLALAHDALYHWERVPLFQNPLFQSRRVRYEVPS